MATHVLNEWQHQMQQAALDALLQASVRLYPKVVFYRKVKSLPQLFQVLGY